jgi:hypothetical protein
VRYLRESKQLGCFAQGLVNDYIYGRGVYGGKGFSARASAASKTPDVSQPFMLASAHLQVPPLIFM